MPEPVVQEETDNKVLPYIGMTRRDFISVVVTGLVVGIAVFALYALLNKFVFGAVLCRPESTGDCLQAPNYSMIVAIIIASIGGVANLARMRVYRPLLVGIAAAVALFGVHKLVADVAWYWGVIDLAVLFALAYIAFTWIARLRNFIVSLVVTIVVVVLSRWLLVA